MRYSNVALVPLEKINESGQTKQFSGLINVKYPDIKVDSQDLYVYVSRGDRYDILSNVYYGDSTLWWIIVRANSNYSQDSLLPPLGKQIRIPSKQRTQIIIEEFESLNRNNPQPGLNIDSSIINSNSLY